MIRSLVIGLLTGYVLFRSGAAHAQGGGSFTTTLINPLDMVRPDEPVIWKRVDLEKRLGPISAAKYLQLTGDERPLLVQLDDLDGDGVWDEAFFVHSFEPRERFRVTVQLADRPAAIKAVVRAHVRMREKNDDDSFGPDLDTVVMPVKNAPTDFSVHRLPQWLTEGPGWENDKVAYRLYFDTRNGKDIYGKRIPAMVMDEVGADPGKSYHELADWGMDILKVGTSLGAGALAFYIPTRGRRDTLMRLGGQHVRREVYRKLSDGPLRAVFRMEYEWEIAGQPVKVSEEISIGAGQYYYSSKVTIQGAPSGSRLVTGIANFYSNEPGNFVRDHAAFVYSYGRQSENKDTLGMAILADKKDLDNFRSLPSAGSEVNSTYTLTQYIHKGQPLYFRFYTAWQKTDPGFSKRDYFMDMLHQEADKYNHPIRME